MRTGGRTCSRFSGKSHVLFNLPWIYKVLVSRGVFSHRVMVWFRITPPTLRCPKLLFKVCLTSYGDWAFTSVADAVPDNINSVSVIDSWTWMWTVHPINFLQIVQGEPRYSSEACLKAGTCRATLAGLVKLASLVSNPEAWRSKD